MARRRAMQTALPGEPRHPRGIPVASDARKRVETVRAGSAMAQATGHYVAAAAEHETVRSCGMVNRMRAAEMTAPDVPERTLSNNLRIYPVYTVYRNKFPRPAGQGVSRIERLIVGISGSQTAGQGALDASMSELVQAGGSFSNYPLSLPPAGSQQFAQLNVPCMN